MRQTRDVVVAVATVLALAQAVVFGDGPGRAAASSSRDLFQWYVEWDNVNYAANPPTITQAVPQGRVAVIDFVTFSARYTRSSAWSTWDPTASADITASRSRRWSTPAEANKSEHRSRRTRPARAVVRATAATSP
jgi:hypothetical protein